MDFVQHICKMKLRLNSFSNSAAIEKKTSLIFITCIIKYYVLYIYAYLLLCISSHCLFQNKETNSILFILKVCLYFCNTEH